MSLQVTYLVSFAIVKNVFWCNTKQILIKNDFFDVFGTCCICIVFKTLHSVIVGKAMVVGPYCIVRGIS